MCGPHLCRQPRRTRQVLRGINCSTAGVFLQGEKIWDFTPIVNCSNIYLCRIPRHLPTTPSTAVSFPTQKHPTLLHSCRPLLAPQLAPQLAPLLAPAWWEKMRFHTDSNQFQYLPVQDSHTPSTVHNFASGDSLDGGVLPNPVEQIFKSFSTPERGRRKVKSAENEKNRTIEADRRSKLQLQKERNLEIQKQFVKKIKSPKGLVGSLYTCLKCEKPVRHNQSDHWSFLVN